ncbi:hypothetical protein ACFLYU_05235, partial [Candidatus Dependentiae bacterium]
MKKIAIIFLTLLSCFSTSKLLPMKKKIDHKKPKVIIIYVPKSIKLHIDEKILSKYKEKIISKNLANPLKEIDLNAMDMSSKNNARLIAFHEDDISTKKLKKLINGQIDSFYQEKEKNKKVKNISIVFVIATNN